MMICNLFSKLEKKDYENKTTKAFFEALYHIMFISIYINQITTNKKILKVSYKDIQKIFHFKEIHHEDEN